MSDRPLTHATAIKPIQGKRRLKWEPIAMLYARFALAAAFLSAVAARFGIWGENAGPDSFKHFLEYAAEVTSFLPAFTIPFLAWAATVAETFLGVAFVLGIWARFGGTGCGVVAGFVWHSHGDFVRHQIAVGLLGIFRIRGSIAAIHLPDPKRGR